MYLILGIVLLAIWIGLVVMFKAAGLVIHLALVFAVLCFVMQLFSSRKAT